jgi:hypothetical protein
MDFLHEQGFSQMYFILGLIGAVGVFSLFLRRDREKRSSWPTWLFVPLAVCVTLPLGSLVKPPDPMRPIYMILPVLIILRWFVALIVRERSRAWILYLVLLFTVPLIAVPLLQGLTPRFLP